jgi:tripartite-type tricarboxylate transporter receptor subunit TctC
VPEDFTMIGAAVEAPHGLFVAANSPHKTAQSFFAAAKQKEVSVGSTSPGGAAHIGLEMVKLHSKARLLYVPYRGSGPAITDLLGGQIEGFFATAPPIMSQVKSGKMRLLAVTGEKRNPSMPEVPTFLELGIPVVVTQWYGLAAPAGTPADVVALLSRHLSLALADPEVKKKIRLDGAVETDVATEAFRRYVVEDIARYRDNIDPAVLQMTK